MAAGKNFSGLLAKLGGGICALALGVNAMAGDFDYLNYYSGVVATSQAPQISIDQTNRFSSQVATALSSPITTNTVWMPSGGKVSTGATGARGAGVYDRGVELFGTVYGGFSGQDKLGSRYETYRNDTVGVTLGYGKRLGEELLVGLLGNYSYAHANFDVGAADLRDNMLRAGFFGKYEWDKFRLISTPTFGLHQMATSRGAFGAKARSEYAAIDISWYNQIAYAWEPAENWQITPTYALGATWMHRPDYRETGAGAGSPALFFDTYNHWSLSQNLLVNINYTFDLGHSFKLTNEIYGGWEYEYLNNAGMKVSLGDQQGNFYGDAPKNRALFGAGIRAAIGDNYEIYGRYDQRLWDGGFATIFAVGASVKF